MSGRTVRARLVGARRAAEVGLSRPVRVVTLSDHLGHPDGRVHGGTTYFTTVWPRLRAAGVELQGCFIGPEHAAAAALRDGGVPVRFLNRRPADPRCFVGVWRALREMRPDIVHASSLKSMYLARRFARALGARVVIHLHDTNPIGRVMKAIQRSVRTRTDLALAVSDAVGRCAVDDFRVDAARVRTLHNGIDLSRFSAGRPDARGWLRSLIGAPEETPLVGMVARLHPMKGHRHLIAAMPALRARVPGARAVLVGEGELRAELVQRAAALGVADAVCFVGQRDDVPDVVAGLDVVAAPSVFGEGLPYVAIEAMAAGRPIVAFPTAGLTDLVEPGVSGTLVPAGDDAALAGALADLLGQPEACRRLGESARWVAARFSLEEHVETLLAIYSALAGPDPASAATAQPPGDHHAPRPLSGGNTPSQTWQHRQIA